MDKMDNDFVRNWLLYGFWLTVGLLITGLQLILIAAALGMSQERFAALIDEQRDMIMAISVLNACVTVFTLAGGFLLALHLAGVL